jgi:hypothetical protein
MAVFHPLSTLSLTAALLASSAACGGIVNFEDPGPSGGGFGGSTNTSCA